ncbi:MAG: hypothetical protein BJG00_001970 [Limnothrix sp. CACIAM 69d]|nr:MAG: hypothetical protein BJG00_001970 [Limnothrix sp. CACIAM 69d]
MIEDYESAHLERAIDQSILDKGDRRIASMHMGGIAIECRLKALILGHFPEKQRDWKPNPKSKHQHSHHCNIFNPGHDLHQALNELDKLGVVKAPDENNENIQDALATIQNPLPGYSFINLRYYGGSLEALDYEGWETQYQIFKTWLDQQLLSSP